VKSRSVSVRSKSIPRKIRELYRDSLLTRLQASSVFEEVWDDPWRLDRLYLRRLVNQVHQKIQHLLLYIHSIRLDVHHAITFVYAVDWTFLNTGFVFDINTWKGDYVGHVQLSFSSL